MAIEKIDKTLKNVIVILSTSTPTFQWQNLMKIIYMLYLTNFLMKIKTLSYWMTLVLIYFIMYTAWKVSLFGVFLVRILPHLDWIRRDNLLSIKKLPNKMSSNISSTQNNSSPNHYPCRDITLPFHYPHRYNDIYIYIYIYIL